MGREQALSTGTLDAAFRAPVSLASERSFAVVETCADPALILDDWAELEGVAPISGYQTRRWVLAWLDTIGRAKGIVPMFVLARDRSGRAVALLPLGIDRRGPLRAAVFLGSRHSNINLGLFRPGPTWTAAELARLLAEAARAASPAPHLYALLNQPFRWAGAGNPLALLPQRPSPSFLSIGDLEIDAEAALARRFSPDARKKLRKKARRLAGHTGCLQHIVARDRAQALDMLAAFHRQKSARLHAAGLPDVYGCKPVRAFLERGATEGLENGEPAIELHALYAGKRIAAVFGGAVHGGRFSGMFNSFDTEAEVARSSPGDLLMMDILREKCREGCLSLDLGVGEAPYKAAYCERVEPLFDTIVPVTLAGQAAAPAVALGRMLKRSVKRTPWLWSSALALRRLAAEAHSRLS